MKPKSMLTHPQPMPAVDSRPVDMAKQFRSPHQEELPAPLPSAASFESKTPKTEEKAMKNKTSHGPIPVIVMAMGFAMALGWSVSDRFYPAGKTIVSRTAELVQKVPAVEVPQKETVATTENLEPVREEEHTDVQEPEPFFDPTQVALPAFDTGDGMTRISTAMKKLSQ